ncbi:hypothetical protein DSM112329_00824 [Paraconexibacter sp. AEG42_29]|uniref:Uncharacterized protein n=1 Tax=Paraconexibacter sp. AEG42_29 TaxID=2997339 RepID=A0AAU7ARK4_9ACTN
MMRSDPEHVQVSVRFDATDPPQGVVLDGPDRSEFAGWIALVHLLDRAAERTRPAVPRADSPG